MKTTKFYKSISLLALLTLLTFSLAHGEEYGNYDLKLIPTVSETASGKKYGIDGVYLDKWINDLAYHAQNYPPRFDSNQDRQRAVKDIKMLSGMLDITVNGTNPHPDILWRAGLINSMGHNLDIPGSAEKTDAIFRKLFTAQPSHPRGNHIYGMFLAGSGRPEKALPYLKTALSAGVKSAAYSLGMTYLTLGNKQKALEYMEAYQKSSPDDRDIARLIDSIQKGKVEIKRSLK